MKEQLNAIYEKAVESIKNAEQLKDIDEIKVMVLGKKANLQEYLREWENSHPKKDLLSVKWQTV